MQSGNRQKSLSKLSLGRKCWMFERKLVGKCKIVWIWYEKMSYICDEYQYDKNRYVSKTIDCVSLSVWRSFNKYGETYYYYGRCTTVCDVIQQSFTTVAVDTYLINFLSHKQHLLHPYQNCRRHNYMIINLTILTRFFLSILIIYH